MRHNMGRSERIIRVFLAIAFFVVSFWVGTGGLVSLQLITALIGLALAITGIFSYCPINALLRYNSCNACRVGETHAHYPV
jgi:low temperature requirement protein LtrA